MPTVIRSCTCPKNCSETYCEKVCWLWGYDTENDTCEYDCRACECGAYGKIPEVRPVRFFGFLFLDFAVKVCAAETPSKPVEKENPHGDFASIPSSEFREQLGGTVGLRVGTENGELVVSSVVEGSPAGQAKIKKGDRILAIDGFSTRGMKLEKAVQFLRGKPGTMVVLRLKKGVFPWGKKVALIRSIASYSEMNGVVREPRIRALNVPLDDLGGKACPPRQGECNFFRFSQKSRVCVYTCLNSPE